MKYILDVKFFLMKDFSEWLEEQLNDRGLKPADLTNSAKIGKGTVYNVLNRTRRPGPDICLAIAQALNLPPEEVFRKAGRGDAAFVSAVKGL